MSGKRAQLAFFFCAFLIFSFICVFFFFCGVMLSWFPLLVVCYYLRLGVFIEF